MDIHRTGKVADWYSVPEQARNRWQKIASATHGYLTPGNVVSFVGAIVTIWGLILVGREQFAAGFVTVAAGRFCDILDGYVAHYTGTKSSLGEVVDAGFDKAVLFAAFATLIVADIVPFLLMLVLVVQQLIAAALGGYARVRHLHMHPSKLGKIATAGQWIALLGYIFAAVDENLPDMFLWILHGVFVITIIAGVIATYGYARHIIRAQNQNRNNRSREV